MYYTYEIYTKHPETGESGWDIESGWLRFDHTSIVGTCDETALRIVKKHYPLFDCVIQLYHANPNDSDLVDGFLQ